jgi:hypothetical protein
MIQGAIITNPGGFANDYAHAVVNKASAAYHRARVDFNTC